MAEWTGLEPATPGVTGRYSNQLNYHSAKLDSTGLNGCLAVTYFHMAAATLSSARLRFTTEFGMGSGGSTALWPPGINCNLEG